MWVCWLAIDVRLDKDEVVAIRLEGLERLARIFSAEHAENHGQIFVWILFLQRLHKRSDLRGIMRAVQNDGWIGLD